VQRLGIVQGLHGVHGLLAAAVTPNAYKGAAMRGQRRIIRWVPW
jgi:hypothetical protein